MIRQTDIPHVQPGEPVSAALLNQLREGANTGRQMTGDGTVSVTTVGGSAGFSDPRPPPVSDRGIPVRIVSAGLDFQEIPLPGGVYQGKMYMQPGISVPNPAIVAGTRATTATVLPFPNTQTCYVINYEEFGQSTHQIPADITVNGHAIGVFRGLPLVGLNVPAGVKILKITGAASGGGKYNARILTGANTGTASTVGSSDLAMPEGMTVPSADNALFYNLSENGSSGHALAVDGSVFVSAKITGNTYEGQIIAEGNAGTGTPTGGSTLLYAKTTTGDSLSAAGTFASVFSITPYMVAGSVLRIKIGINQAPAFITDNVYAVSLAGPGTAIGGPFSNLLGHPGSAGTEYWSIEIELTVVDASHVHINSTGIFMQLSSSVPTAGESLSFSVENSNVSTTPGNIQVSVSSTGAVAATTLVTMTVERLR